MKQDGNQNKLYLLSGVLLALTIAIAAIWGVWLKPGAAPDTIGETHESGHTAVATAQPTATAMPETTIAPAADAVKTVAYYQDNYGYLVPVTRTIENEPGIAKATLATMVSSVYNDMEAARLGLRTVLPENTAIDLDVMGDGLARIDLGEEVLHMRDAEAETNMVAAVVQTLTEFPTVDRVEFLVGGKKRASLTYGTDISGEFMRGAINLESAEAAFTPGEASAVQLYFPGDTSSLIVPVTRMVYGSGDIHTAVLELAKGPSTQSPLERALPSGCGLIGVQVENGVATINFTREFVNIAEESDGGRAALRALVLTCTQFEGVRQVQIQVEGEPYDPGTDTLAVTSFVNDADSLAEEYIRTQTALLLDAE